MKKMKFINAGSHPLQTLSKEQLKKVIGGTGSGGGVASCYCTGKSTSACPSGTATCEIKKDNGTEYALCDGKKTDC